MLMTREAVRQCWADILFNFLEYGFSKEEIEFELNQEGSSFIVVFSARVFEELKRVSEKPEKELGSFLKLEFRLNPQSRDGEYLIKTKKGEKATLDLATIQHAMAMTLLELKSEKNEKIRSARKRIEEELKKAMEGYPDLEMDKKPITYYLHGTYTAKISLKRIKGRGRKPCPFDINAPTPKGVVRKFKDFISCFVMK